MARRVSHCGKSAVRTRKPRRAFSLLEVILAISILCGAAVLIGQLVGNASQYAQQARDNSRAQLLAESKLAELLSGVTALEPVSGISLDNRGEWIFSLEVLSTAHEGVLELILTIEQSASSQLRPVSYTLTRWVRDPDWVPVRDTEAPAQ